MSGRETCTCATPVPQTRALRKGAATTECTRCGLPIAPSLRQSPPQRLAVAPDTLPDWAPIAS